MASSSVFSEKPVRALIVGGGAAVLGAILLLLGALDGPERTLWDWRVRTLAAPTEATDDVVLVLINQESLDLMSQQNGIDWPWPRQFYGFMLSFFESAGAASVTIDLILQDAGFFGLEDSRALQAAAGSFGSVVYGIQLTGRDPELIDPWPDYVRRPPLSLSGTEALTQGVANYGGATWPDPGLVPENAILADVVQENDADGVFRRYRLVVTHGGEPVPTLALAALLASADDELSLEFREGSLFVNELRVPVDAEGRFLLRYTTPGGIDPDSGSVLPAEHRSFPAFDVVISGFNVAQGSEPTLDPELFADKHVLIGPSAAGLLDLRPTPLNPRAPGVTAHATALDNLLAGEFLREFPVWASLLLIVLICVGASFAATYSRRTITEIFLIVFFLAAAAAISVGGYLLDFWVPMVVPMISAFFALAAANVANYATEGAEKRFISGAFGTYVSPALVNQLMENPERLSLQGERRELTMLFSDIQGFTTLSEGLEPEQLSEFLTHYLTELVTIIQDEDGTIDKFEGDAIIAFWNAPLDVDEHATRAVRAALACQKRLTELRPEYAKAITAAGAEGGIPGVGRDIFTRIGLNTGVVSVGNFGSESRFDYTALGDGMNLAARLEGANKVFGTYTMISRDTKSAMNSEFPTRELGRIAVVGRAEPVTVFEPMLHEVYEARRAMVSAYERGLNLWYNNRMDEARAEFATIAGEDPVAKGMMERCDHWISRPVAERAAWTGVVTLTQK